MEEEDKRWEERDVVMSIGGINKRDLTRMLR